MSHLHSGPRGHRPPFAALRLLAATSALAGCTASHAREVASAGTITVGSSAAAAPTTAIATAPASPPPTIGSRRTTRIAADLQVEKAWLASINDFYRASELGSTNLSILDATLVPGSRELAQETGFISLQVVSGVVGPSAWRIGSVRVASLTGDTAAVTACSYDPGSHFRSSGYPAPPPLGGGAGLTAYVAHLRDVAGRWLLYATGTSAPTSTSEVGPCFGF
jgi:hypothetical protein